MVDRNNVGKLLSFPAPAPVPGSSGEDWSRRIVEIRDNLVSALEFIAIRYKEGLAGKPVRAADEILGQIVTILRHDEKMPFVHGCGSHQDSWIGVSRGRTKGPPALSESLKQCLKNPTLSWTTPNWKRLATW